MNINKHSNSCVVVPLKPQPEKPQQWVSGAIIDEQGREIPITEQMIQHACRELEQACCSASRQAR